MKLERRAKKFLKLLAKELDLPKGSSKRKIRNAFEEGLKLVENGELQAELTDNSDNYLPLLQRYVLEVKNDDEDTSHHEDNSRVVETTNEDTEGKTEDTESGYPFNLYLSKKKVADLENVSVYKCLWSQQFDESCVEKIADKPEKAVLGICNVTQGTSASLESIMMVFHRKMSNIVDDAFVDMQMTRFRSIENNLLRFLLYFHTKYNPTDRIKSEDVSVAPKYEDIVAALLSLYVDVSCTIARTAEESDIAQLQSKMVMLINHVLRFSTHHVMDVLIQMTQMSKEDTQFLLPLVRDVIENPSSSTKQPEVYTKYILTVQKISSTLEGEEIERLQKIALSTKAPKKYLKWLRERDEEVLDNMPDNDPSFKGVNITRHLLEDSSEDVFERLVNLLTTEENVLPDDQESEESTTFTGLVDVSNENLFFIDRRTAQNDAEDNIEEIEDEEEIVIDDEMLDKELAAMDADGTENVQSDTESENGDNERNIVENTAKALSGIGVESPVETVSEDEECLDAEELNESEDEGFGDNAIVVDEVGLRSTHKATPALESQSSPKRKRSKGSSDIFFIDSSPCKTKSTEMQKQQSKKGKGIKQAQSPVIQDLSPVVCLGSDVVLSPFNHGQIESPRSKGKVKPVANDSSKKKSLTFLERGMMKSTHLNANNVDTPRPSNRSHLKQAIHSIQDSHQESSNGNVCENSSLNGSVAMGENDVEVYDLSTMSDTTFSEVESPVRKIKRKTILQVDTQSDQFSDTSALSTEEIEEETTERETRSSRGSIVPLDSQNDQCSDTSALSTEDIEEETTVRETRSTTISSLRSAEKQLRRGPGRPRKVRGNLSDAKGPTCKKQRVEPPSRDSPVVSATSTIRTRSAKKSKTSSDSSSPRVSSSTNTAASVRSAEKRSASGRGRGRPKKILHPSKRRVDTR